MLPPRLQSQGPAAAGIFSERGKRCPVRARSPAEEADRTAAVPLPAPAPAARERPLAEPALPGRLPSSRYRARTQEPRHRAYLKGTQAETPQQDPPCAASWLSTEISQPPAPRARRPAAPGRKMPGSCPSVSAGRRPPLPIRRCTAPPHNLLQPPPPRRPRRPVCASPSPAASTWHACSRLPLSPSPSEPSGSPRGDRRPEASGAARAAGPPPAFLHRHGRRPPLTSGARRAGQPPRRAPAAGSPGGRRPARRPPGGRAHPSSKARPAATAAGPPRPTPRRPARPQPGRPAPRRAALRRPSAGQPPGKRPAKGSPRAGSERSGAEGRARSPRPTDFVFAPNSLCPWAPAAAERRAGRSESPGVYLRQRRGRAGGGRTGIAGPRRGSPRAGRGASFGPGGPRPPGKPLPPPPRRLSA